MAEVINTNVFDADKKFVDFAGLDYFWEKAKAYVDGADKVTADKVTALEGVVGDSTKGLVKDVNYILDELETISGGVGSVGTQIDNAIAALKLAETYEVKGEAAKAEAAAKSYVDGKVDGKFDAVGSAAAVADDLADHVADAVAHVTADERASWNSAKTAIDAFLKDADMTADAVDTLKELQTYMTTDGSAAAELVGRVAVLEALDHDAYKAADTALETSLKGYVDGKVDGKFDAAGAAATAKSEAIADAESKYQVKGDYEVAGAAATALADAKTYADGKFQIAGNYEVAGAAATAKSEAIAQAKADAADALKSYYTKTEVDNLLSSNSTGDRAYAKQYTDELFGSFKFAANSDIDALFV